MALKTFLNLFRRKQNETSQNQISEIEKIQKEIKLNQQKCQDIMDQDSSHINNPSCKKRQYKLSKRRYLRRARIKKTLGKMKKYIYPRVTPSKIRQK